MATSRRISDTVARLLALSKPRYIDGRWRRPAIGKRELNVIRKSLVAEGEYWPRKPLRDRSKDKPLKLTKRERDKPARLALIEENMRKMPAMIAEYRKQLAEGRERKRKKEQKTEEEIYLLATGKKKREGPHWLMQKELKSKKR